MAEHDDGAIRRVAWFEVFRWLHIVGAFRLAIGVRGLILGALGAIVMATGWWLIGWLFIAPTAKSATATDWLAPYVECPWKAITDKAVPETPGVPFVPASAVEKSLASAYAAELLDTESPAAGWRPHDAVGSPARLLTKPARAALTWRNASFRDLLCLGFCGLWGVAVWALFGGAMCRTAALQLAADEHVGLLAALRFAWHKWPAYCAAPLMPVAAMLLAAICIAIVGLLMNWIGVLVGGVLWPLVLVAGFVMGILLLGALFGWPLMWGAISTEGTDSFDALSRSYSYTFQRPLCYLFYAIVAAVIGWLGWLLVANFAAAVIWLGYWAADWGFGHDGVRAIGGFSGWLIHFWTGCVKLLAVGYLFSYFWSVSAAAYLLLRRDVDATEIDEVFLDADGSEPAGELPPITTDEAGAPVVGDSAESAE
ncbi:MAG: hypothetical protein ABFC96_06525 [Thermoguttaceae bacterium]